MTTSTADRVYHVLPTTSAVRRGDVVRRVTGEGICTNSAHAALILDEMVSCGRITQWIDHGITWIAPAEQQ